LDRKLGGLLDALEVASRRKNLATAGTRSPMTHNQLVLQAIEQQPAQFYNKQFMCAFENAVLKMETQIFAEVKSVWSSTSTPP